MNGLAVCLSLVTFQGVCEHFEGVLKMMSLVKSLLKAGTNVGVARSTGILTHLPDGGEELGGVLYSTCVKLIQHIMGRQPCAVIAGASPSTRDRQSKEVRVVLLAHDESENHYPSNLTLFI